MERFFDQGRIRNKMTISKTQDVISLELPIRETSVHTKLFQNSALLIAIISFSIPSYADSNGSQASQKESPLNFELNIGVEYDSSVSISEVDDNTAADDFALVFDADVDYEKNLSKNTSLNLSYSFSQSLHDEFTDFNLQTHFATADIAHDFGNYDIGGSYRYIFTLLDNDNFLTLQQLSPYFSTFVGKNLYLRADYTYIDKEFDVFEERDATANSVGADVYYFLEGTRRYFVLGYQYRDEDADDAQFDFESQNYKIRFVQRFQLGKRDMIGKLFARFDARNYDSITRSIGEVRDDDRTRIGAELEIPINDKASILVEYEYSEFDSNLPAADKTQNIIAVKMGFQF